MSAVRLFLMKHLLSPGGFVLEFNPLLIQFACNYINREIICVSWT